VINTGCGGQLTRGDKRLEWMSAGDSGFEGEGREGRGCPRATHKDGCELETDGRPFFTGRFSTAFELR